MLLEIITPEHQIFKGEVDSIQLPGLDGSFQVLKGHAPIISGLSKGSLKVELTSAFEGGGKASELIEKDKTNSKLIHVAIKGGVVEFLNDKMIVLAE